LDYTTCASNRSIVAAVVTAKMQYNLKNAREYFEEYLCVGDCYNDWQRVAANGSV